MSEQLQTRNLDRRQPVRKARPTRQSASGPGGRVASARDVAIYLRDDCRTLRDSLQLEMVVAQYCLRIRDLVTTGGVPIGDVVGVGVVAELEREGDALSHAIMRAIAHLAAGETADRSAEAATRLTQRITGLPQQFADVGKARALSAWRTGADLDGEYAVFADFEYPRGGGGHAIALFVDSRHGAVVKHIGLLSPMSELDPDEPLHPNALEPVTIPAGGALMREALEHSYGPLGAESHDHRVPIAAARARSMALSAQSGSGDGPD